MFGGKTSAGPTPNLPMLLVRHEVEKIFHDLPGTKTKRYSFNNVEEEENMVASV